MEITSITLSLARPPVAPSLPFSSSQSNFFSTGSTISLFNKAKSHTKSVSFVVGRPRRGTTAEPAKKGLTCNALFGLGVPELVVIAGVAALLFGPKKLPEVGKSIGKTVKSFQQAAKEFETELKKEPESMTEQPKENTTAVSEEKKPDLEVSSSKESV
ncbi:Sec-independent translocase protein TatA [Gossypium arboreum]|uniref:Sec-independent translocase protein TatA n=1 Tax=Gossypium arboreum TaxID=29729 RepID=A0A0B0MTA3_GOSAR|nr:sec-independent protein translocase protein TATA, chloroplastic [Gossypium arboreum]KHG04000.1 Sec-independent translocase protein TatA [Gossypium arboreum]